MNTFVIIDLEATGNVNAKNKKIIEVAIVLIKDKEIMSEYTTLINPQTEIPFHISDLTGITKDSVQNAPLFHEVATKIKSMVANYPIVAHNVLFDIRFLNKEFELLGLAPLENEIIDTVELTKIMYPTVSSYKLNGLATFFNFTHDNPHRALSDAYVTAELFIKLLYKIAQLPKETVNHLLKLEPAFHSDLRKLFIQYNNDSQKLNDGHLVTLDGLTFKSVFDSGRERSKLNTSFGHILDDTYNINGLLTDYITNYEMRDGQRLMSELIFDAFQAQQHALIEAQPGSGKTLAYLLTSIYEAVKNNETIIVSTEKTNLQMQMIEGELPLLQKTLPFTFKYALLKGKTHYLSLERFHHYLPIKEESYSKNLLKAMILIWILETPTGDIHELKLPEGTQFFMNNMTAEMERKSSSSSWFKWSYYERAFNNAKSAHILIINHALLSADLFLNHELLPHYDKAIIDEAHVFEDSVSKQFSLSINFQYIRFKLNEIGTTEGQGKLGRILRKTGISLDRDHWNNTHQTFISDLKQLSNYLIAYIKNRSNLQSNELKRSTYTFDINQGDTRAWYEIVEQMKRLIYSLNNLLTEFTELQLINNEEKTIIDDLTKVIIHFEQFINNLSDQAIWVEVDNNHHNIYMYKQQLNINSFLYDYFFDKKKSIILTSATLTVNHSFSFIKEQLGLQSNVLERAIKSPFSMVEQSTLMIPNDFPSVLEFDEFIYATTEAIISLVEITKGRMLVLFTSHKMLKAVYYLLDETIGSHYNLIAQDITALNSTQLKNEFRDKEKSVLLGTNSFWEGINIPGDALNCLVIVRLPFENPNDPMHFAKSKQIEEAGKNSFYRLALPRAIIRLNQGIGRLIRSQTDYGIIFVLDSRLYESSYGQVIIDSMNEIPINYDTTKNLISKSKAWLHTKEN